MSLEPPAPLTRRELRRFERRVALPLAWRTLRRELGAGRALLVLTHVVCRRLRGDPLAGLVEPDTRAAATQLRGALLLADALDARVSDPDRRSRILEEVVVGTGARYLAAMIPAVDPGEWLAGEDSHRARFAAAVLARFPNVVADPPRTSSGGLAFDVRTCHFADLTRRAGRPELARLFCRADAAHFDAEAPLSFERSGSLAEGASCCDFRFRLRTPPGREGGQPARD